MILQVRAAHCLPEGACAKLWWLQLQQHNLQRGPGLAVFGSAYHSLSFFHISPNHRRRAGLWDVTWHPICPTRWECYRNGKPTISNQVNTYTIEVSMLGYEDHDSRQIIPYTDDLYAKVMSALLCCQAWCFSGWKKYHSCVLGLLQDSSCNSTWGWWSTYLQLHLQS